ncbi:hypothetical protein QMO56_06140 [Roseomonas sp. E05]|uniref:hypothetical protein n=1 Tax=Roseomonas sp. E05 TaxID=3046310 RepID=UPI0024BB16AE|nr:hypothetical protein [Roseomonas sp. E05]MDJ0387686.1 hypothetical protein [Roseomonas sp. E05]
MLGWVMRLCRDRRSIAVLEYGLVGVLVAVVIISSVQLLITSGSQDLPNPDMLLRTPRPGS